jgi:hypothetical protein
VPSDQPETTRVYDPATDTYVVRPAPPAVDTIAWTPSKRPPAIQDESSPTPSDTVSVPGRKPGAPVIKPSAAGDFPRVVTVRLALPLEAGLHAGEAPDARQSRFMQYYAGLRLALDETSAGKRGIDWQVVTSDRLRTSQEDRDAGTPHILIGPYERDSIEAWLGRMAGRNALLVSPWLPAFTPKAPSPELIQLTPGLERHAEAIMRFIRETMPGQRVVLVSRDNPAERSRLGLFAAHAGDLDHHELIVKDTRAPFETVNLAGQLSKTGTVFILPVFARQDEAFVSGFLRKLAAEKGEMPVTVFGMPQWTGFSGLNTGHMEGLNLHLSEPAWPSADPETLKAFREKFYARYKTVPDINACQGYDLGRWMAETLERSGKRGLTGDSRPWSEGLCSGFDIRPVRAPGEGGDEVQFYENASIRIIRFRYQDFEPVR